MKKIILSIIASICAIALNAQDNPVTWNWSINDDGDGTKTLVFDATVDEGFHLYDLGPYEGGPTPTSFTFTTEGDVELIGSVGYGTEPVRANDDIFGMEIGSFTGTARFIQKFRHQGNAGINVTIEWMCCNDVSCIPPTDEEFTIDLSSTPVTDTAADNESAATPKNTGHLWSLILEAILWGIAALLTPCVFPMIPMTVSYFIKGSGDKLSGKIHAMTYGLFIILLYTVPIALIILITRVVGGAAVTADIFNWLSTHWLPNIIFFLVFMVFAASFFGAFEIVLPSSMVNGSDSKSDRKSLAGIFFMALTLVLVSFSCTGPIVGTVLIKSTEGEFWTPMITMLAFSVAFALPFTLFALFPSFLQKLPKSGGWLNSVKVVLGFIEIALGLKFLSTADQTYQWGILDRETYLAIWIVCFSMLGFYLLGKLRFKNDSPVEHISVIRLALSIAVFSFVVYMIPGMWGAPLKAISGYLPPMQTQDFVLEKYAVPQNAAAVAEPEGTVKYGDGGLKLPHGLTGFFDLDEAEAYAEKIGKPLFIDFTGLGCMNCREMEARVLSDPQILQTLREDYVVVAVFGDDKKTQVSQEEWVVTESGKTLKTLGKINSYRMLKEFGVNAQPYYILKGKGKLLAPPRSYDLDVEAFRRFLRDGLEAYKADGK
ncbi:MAG: thioredoxin family protein [Bacteroidales bacterium]|nr:thioredoxin family protein [Candidatus Cacconaster equifaecalis]